MGEPKGKGVGDGLGMLRGPGLASDTDSEADMDTDMGGPTSASLRPAEGALVASVLEGGELARLTTAHASPVPPELAEPSP